MHFHRRANKSLNKLARRYERNCDPGNPNNANSFSSFDCSHKFSQEVRRVEKHSNIIESGRV